MSNYVAQWAGQLVREIQTKPAKETKVREKKRIGFTKKRHIVVGSELHKMRGELHRLANETCKAYGPASNAHKQALRLCATLDNLRATLDGKLAEETGIEVWRSEDLGSVYYPLSKSINSG